MHDELAVLRAVVKAIKRRCTLAAGWQHEPVTQRLAKDLLDVIERGELDKPVP